MHDQESNVSSVNAADYRLPASVIPDRYEIRLVPDLKNFTFDGEVSIAISVLEPTSQIVLNALDLQIDSTTISGYGKTISARVTLDESLERAALSLASPIAAGAYSLKIVFRGILNDKLHGFYRSQYKDSEGITHTIASTQFEATDARRAFPCWDEPALKAVYSVILVIDDKLMAISNAGTQRENKIAGGKKEVVFRDTIKMSTYLVAFIVGEFEATAPVDVNGTLLRVVHPPGKSALAKYGLEIGAFSLRWFSDYYGLKYPGDKLDLVAIPDFASGAMENLGAITFRETALLVDEKTASRGELERVADVVSHENAHMWFGDLVTMRWWNGIWLNEAFATFMEMLAVDAFRPKWQRWTTFGTGRAAAMATDGLRSTRPIEFPVQAPDECRAMFDVLTYEKGAAVLRMLEQYIGGEEFRKGIALYLSRHKFANTETGDLWDAIEDSCGAPVRALMDSWIFQPGFPIVSVAASPDRRSLQLSQRRFFYLPEGQKEDAAKPQVWHVPVMVKVKTDSGLGIQKLLMNTAEATLDLPGQLEWVIVNQGGHGFYRSRYSSELLAVLTRNLSALASIERFALVNDTWASVVAGFTPLSDFLKTSVLFESETDLNVWRALLGGFNYLDMIADEPDRKLLAVRVRGLVSDVSARLGWSPLPNEDELSGSLRGTMVSTLGILGDDKPTQDRARSLYNRYREDPATLDRNLVPAVIAIVAHTGDETDYRQFKQNFKSAKNPQEEQRYLFALAGFRKPELLKQTLEMTLSTEVRTQNAPYLLHALLYNPVSRDEAWSFMKAKWSEMEAKYPDNAIPRMCEGVVTLVKYESEVTEFFKTHKVREGGKTIDQHLERLKINSAFKSRHSDLGALLKF
jgi:puromycin-sensitive aminopeptidase